MKEDMFIIANTEERKFPDLKGVYQKVSPASRCCGFQRTLVLLKVTSEVPANNPQCHVKFKR